MKLIMEIWRKETLTEFAPGGYTKGAKKKPSPKEQPSSGQPPSNPSGEDKPASGDKPYSENWIGEVSVGEFLKFVKVDSGTLETRIARKLQALFNKGNLFPDLADGEKETWFQKTVKTAQGWASSIIRGGLGWGVGKLVSLIAASPVALKILITVTVLQILTEAIEKQLAAAIEKQLGYHPDDLDFQPTEVEMVFGIEDSVLKLMRGGENEGTTKISKDTIFHLRTQLKDITKKLANTLDKLQLNINDFEKETFLTGTYGYDYYKKLGDEDEQEREKQLAKVSEADKPNEKMPEEAKELKSVLEKYYQFLNTPLIKFVSIDKTANTQALEKIAQKIGNKKPITIPAATVKESNHRRIIYRGKK